MSPRLFLQAPSQVSHPVCSLSPSEQASARANEHIVSRRRHSFIRLSADLTLCLHQSVFFLFCSTCPHFCFSLSLSRSLLWWAGHDSGVCLCSGRLQSPFLSKPAYESERASSPQRQASPEPAGSASPIPATGVNLHLHTHPHTPSKNKPCLTCRRMLFVSLHCRPCVSSHLM